MNYRTAESAPQRSLMVPPTVVPPFVKEIGRLAHEVGLPQAVLEVFEGAGITVEVEGDTLADTAGQGIVIASDHQQTIEPWLSQGLMGVSGRPASYVVGKPSSLQCRLIDHISGPGEGLILPVIPGTFAAEKKGKGLFNNDLWARLRYPSLVRPKAELSDINATAMARATSLVEAGETVTIYPTGTTDDAAKAPWRRGLGALIRGLSADAHDTTQVVVLKPDRVSKIRLIAALSMQGLGLRPHPQTITLRVANLGTPRELFGDDLISDDPEVAQRITDKIRAQYLDRFA